MKKQKLFVVFRFIVALVGWIGIIGYFIMKIITRTQGESVVMSLLNSISHYTIQTNILVLTWIIFALIEWSKKGKVKMDNNVLKTGITMYITFTFVIYAFVLYKLWSPTGVNFILAFISHYVTPVAFIIDWVVCELSNGNHGKKNFKNAVKWLIYPASYVGYVMIYGKFTGRYMYPFLNVSSIGYLGVLIRVFILSILFLLMGMVYIKCSHIIEKHFSLDIDIKSFKILL